MSFRGVLNKRIPRKTKTAFVKIGNQNGIVANQLKVLMESNYLKSRNNDKRFQTEMKETEARYKEMFEEWREWFSDKKSNSTFVPFPFLSSWGV